MVHVVPFCQVPKIKQVENANIFVQKDKDKISDDEEIHGLSMFTTGVIRDSQYTANVLLCIINTDLIRNIF